jgi:hypothetical protein
MKIPSFRNDVPQVHTDPQKDAEIIRPDAIFNDHCVLDRQGAPDSLTDACERYQHRVARGLHKPTTMVAD